jgi:hypothetical protein
MTPKSKLKSNLPPTKVSVEDDNWVEEGRKLKPGEIDEILRKAPVRDGHSRPLAEVMAELGPPFEDDDDLVSPA